MEHGCQRNWCQIANSNANVYGHRRWLASCEHIAKPTKNSHAKATPAKHATSQVLELPSINAAFGFTDWIIY